MREFPNISVREATLRQASSYEVANGVRLMPGALVAIHVLCTVFLGMFAHTRARAECFNL